MPDCDPKNLEEVSNDTYCLAKQWLHAHTLPAHNRGSRVFSNFVDLGEAKVWEGEEQIPQLVGQIISQGTTYWPVADYPKFTTHEISTAYALWQRIKADLGLSAEYAKALTDAHNNHNKDPR